MHIQFEKKKKAHPFYSIGRWRTVREEYMRFRHYICEMCGRPAEQVHHKEPLKDGDYFVNYEKCYGFENLQALCRDCHNRMDGHFLAGKGGQMVADGYRVNMATGELEIIPPHRSEFLRTEEAVSQPRKKLGEER